MNLGKNDTALVLTGPQNDVLSESGVAWPFVGAGVRENRTVENIERLLWMAAVVGSSCIARPTEEHDGHRASSVSVSPRPSQYYCGQESGTYRTGSGEDQRLPTSC